MGTLLDALSQENLDNQREVVKNEKRWSYDNRPVRLVVREAPGPPLPAGAPVPPHDDRLDGGPRRGLASRTSARSSGPTTRRTTRSCRSSATSRRPTARAGRGALLRRHPGQPVHPARSATCRCRRRSAASVRETVHDRVPLPRDLRRVPRPGLRRPRGSTRSTSPARSSPAARAAASTAGSSATSGSPRTSRSSRSGFVGGRVDLRRAGRPSGRASPVERVEAALHEELERLTPRAGHRRRAGPGPGPDRDRRARRRSSGSRSGPTACRCTRRCSTTRT